MIFRRFSVQLAIAKVAAMLMFAALLVPSTEGYTEDPTAMAGGHVQDNGVYNVGVMGYLLGRPLDTGVVIYAIIFSLLGGCTALAWVRWMRLVPR